MKKAPECASHTRFRITKIEVRPASIRCGPSGPTFRAAVSAPYPNAPSASRERSNGANGGRETTAVSAQKTHASISSANRHPRARVEMEAPPWEEALPETRRAEDRGSLLPHLEPWLQLDARNNVFMQIVLCRAKGSLRAKDGMTNTHCMQIVLCRATGSLRAFGPEKGALTRPHIQNQPWTKMGSKNRTKM